MSNAIIDLDLINKIQELLLKDGDPVYATARDELSKISSRIKQGLSLHGIESTNLLREFMDKHPALFATIREQMVEDVLKYVTEVCKYYSEMKSYRALTEEEKKIGRQLKSLLKDAQGLL